MKSWFAFAVADGCRWINKYKNISKNILKLKDYSYIYIIIFKFKFTSNITIYFI